MSRPSTKADPAEIARSYLNAFSSRDADVIVSHVSDDFINEHTAALGTGCHGKQAYRDRLPSFLADMPDLTYQVESLAVDGNTVAAFYTMTARWHGTTPISVRGVQRLTISDGQIVHRVDYWDSATFLMQIDEDANHVLKGYGCSIGRDTGNDQRLDL